MIKISKAILEVMEEVKGIEKGADVGSGSMKYKGVNDKDVKTIIGASMKKHGLSIVPTSVEPSYKIDRWQEEDSWSKSVPKAMKTKQSVFTSVVTKYLLIHDSGETIELSGYGHGVDSQDKGAGKATTYALKNTLLYTFLVPTGTIDDTDITHSQDIEVPQSPPKAPAEVLPTMTDKQITDAIVWIQTQAKQDSAIRSLKRKYKFDETSLLEKLKEKLKEK